MEKMPVLFVGHGSPMNAIEENPFVEEWKMLGRKLPRPKAILAVSAHWFTDGTRVNNAEAPQMVYDMYGFPPALYRIVYGAKGSPHFAHRAAELIGGNTVTFDNSWGLDHGSWSVLHRIFPAADIPVFQLSINGRLSPAGHYQMGRKLRALREEGVLIFGSGNVVHNLATVNLNLPGGYTWAEDFDAYIQENVLKRDDDNVIDYKKAGASALKAFTTIEHFAPLLYVLSAADEADKVSVFNDSCIGGSLSMTSYLIG